MQKVFTKLFDVTLQPFVVDQRQKMVPGKNNYQSIFTALSNAKSNSVIKVNSGVYQQLLQLKQPNIKIIASQQASNAIIINRQYPSITLDMKDPTDKIHLQNLKLAHLCQPNDLFIDNHDLRSFRQSRYRSYKIGQNMNTTIYVKKGTLHLDQCKISLAINRSQKLIPCIMVGEQGTLIMSRCQVKGSKGTIGIICKGGKVIIKQSKIKDHLNGIGIYATGGQKTRITIKNSTFQQCSQGMCFNGPFSGTIQSNNVIDCIDYGINIMGNNTLKILSNEIKNCKVGINITNSRSLLIRNIIKQNQEGVALYSNACKLCLSNLKLNQIQQNEKIGIYVCGVGNKSVISNNQINFNGSQGIKVQKGANPHIFKNKISKNLTSGVHICKGSTSFLQRNEITDSLKSNVIIQGPNNIQNFVFENIISGARGQGIFLSYCQKFLITNNTIQRNHNGILSITSVCTITQNEINQNNSNGIFLVDDNLMAIKKNKISNNGAAGILIRDESKGQISGNIFSSNNYEVVIQNDFDMSQYANIYNGNNGIINGGIVNANNMKKKIDIQKDNYFEGQNFDIRIPKNYQCKII